MSLTIANYRDVAESLLPEWMRRSQSPMILAKGPGCFVWDSKRDGSSGSGMFYTKDMLSKYFDPEMAIDLQKMIGESDPTCEVVVALMFEGKAIGLRLAKSAPNETDH